MNHSAMKLSLVFLMTSGFSAAPERVATDGAVRPDETNVAYQFRCGERLATLR